MHDQGDGNFKEVEQQWLSFSNRKKYYDQIRYLDAEGNEVIRVNYKNEGSYLVPKESLQNKKDRYYFKDTIKLNDRQIYISPLDLNMENNIIEQPEKPMLRVSTPYYDQAGKLKGIVILNYSAKELLEQIKEIADSGNGELFLLNSEGYWLFDSRNNNNEWAFMYKDKADKSFGNSFPDTWKIIQDKNSGYQTNSNGAFIFSNIITNEMFKTAESDYSLVLGSGDWSLVSFLQSGTEEGKLFSENMGMMLIGVMKDNYLWYILMFLLSIMNAALVTINKNEREKIKFFSEYDVMTGAYNRRAGFEKLALLYKEVSRHNCNISICLIDINGLKEVNDDLGHECGDDLIKSVTNGIKTSIRSNDFIARLGGDEFLIIFEGIDNIRAEEIWERIVAGYEEINNRENRRYLISVSHGIETFDCNTTVSIESIVNNADNKMYAEKRIIKKDLKVIR